MNGSSRSKISYSLASKCTGNVKAGADVKNQHSISGAGVLPIRRRVNIASPEVMMHPGLGHKAKLEELNKGTITELASCVPSPPPSGVREVWFPSWSWMGWKRGVTLNFALVYVPEITCFHRDEYSSLRIFDEIGEGEDIRINTNCSDLQAEHMNMRIIDCIDFCVLIEEGPAHRLIVMLHPLGADQG